MWTASFASNMNFPAPLAVMAFLTACLGFFGSMAAAAIFWFARKPKFARVTFIAAGTGAAIYLAVLFGFSAASRTITLTSGQEKYFCEIDCHLAYSVTDVQTQPAGDRTRYLVTLRTRFDETTTSSSRPRDASLTPSPREMFLVDSFGRQFGPESMRGTPPSTPLKPAESYITQLEFVVPKEAPGLKLLLNTIPGWPDRVVIGDENSWLHKKTYFAL